ncbi:hypothetical protein HYALB_00005215 [Hymenoscyphus albidus]|uniref:Uncharacterized protein n=1 Tax=Hymenoscyphus albidus TaxID=595503 RepID=A0A9N9LQU0_9HELO|nr:hypothetical protein HYALB_00005215 [Hymenoscyphus albidus]
MSGTSFGEESGVTPTVLVQMGFPDSRYAMKISVNGELGLFVNCSGLRGHRKKTNGNRRRGKRKRKRKRDGGLVHGSYYVYKDPNKIPFPMQGYGGEVAPREREKRV